MFTEVWLSARYLKAKEKEKIISFTALISMIGIAIGVAVLIIVIAVMSGFDRYLEDKIIGTNSHVLLEFYSIQKEPYKIVEQLKNMPHILAASPFIGGQAFIRSGNQVSGVEFRGIDAVLQPRVTKIEEYLVAGSLPKGNNDLILGQELAYRLGLRMGDKLSLISPVSLKPTEFTIKGIFNSGMYTFDSTLVMTDISSAQAFFNLGTAVSGIGIKVDDVYKVADIKMNLYRELALEGNYDIRTWVDANRNFLSALKLEKVVMFIIVTMTTVVAAFGIASTLIMSVMSKIKDIGILRSIGAKAKSILMVFVFQGLSIGVLGIISGLLIGVSFSLSLNKIVDGISKIIGRSLIPKDIYYFDKIPTYVSYHDVSLIVISALVISLLASIYPAYYAAKINPSEALRHE